jgi:hypothetical protein
MDSSIRNEGLGFGFGLWPLAFDTWFFWISPFWDRHAYKDLRPKTKDHFIHFIASLTIAVSALSCSVLLRCSCP